MQETAKEFMTAASLLTFSGASAGVLVVTNTCRRLFGANPVGVSFVTSMVISFVGAGMSGGLKNWGVGILLALLNGCMLFCAAAGLNETSANAIKPAPSAAAAAAPPGWAASWFKS